MKNKNNPLVKLSIYVIRKIWHGTFGRDFNKKRNIMCRFYPSCSNYAVMAIQKYGFFKGWYLAYNRVRRCNFKNTESCVDHP